MIIEEDVLYAAAILSKYRKNAIARKNEKAQKEIEAIMKVVNDLWKIGKDVKA